MTEERTGSTATEPRCQFVFPGTRNRCDTTPTHAVHIYGAWSGPEPYHAFVPAASPSVTEPETPTVPRHTHFVGSTSYDCEISHEADAVKQPVAEAAATPQEREGIDVERLRAEIRANREQGVKWEPPVDPKIERWYAEGYDRALRDVDAIAARLSASEPGASE